MPFRSKPSQFFANHLAQCHWGLNHHIFFMQITWQMAFNSETSEFLFQISCPKPLRSEPLQNQYEVYISILFNNHVIPRVVLFTWHSAKYLCWWPGILITSHVLHSSNCLFTGQHSSDSVTTDWPRWKVFALWHFPIVSILGLPT